MLRTVAAGGRAGREALRELLVSRRAPDLAAVREALPIVEEVLSDPRPPRALLGWVERLDGVKLSARGLVVDPSRVPAPRPDPSFAAAFRLARRRIASYHRRQLPRGFSFRDRQGVSFRERPVPLESVGVYVPGGRAFYPSSLLMGAVPAQVAGVPRVVVATPPRAFRESPELRWALRELGIREVLLAGGAHGVAGLVGFLGCRKVVGPGNRWVAAAKHLVSALVSVDLPAGPSEVLVVASGDAPPELVAADLLAQAEHDPEAVCVLFTDSAELASRVGEELAAQLPDLATAATARAALERRALAVVFGTLGEAVAPARAFAAEHLQLMGRGAGRLRGELEAHAGALFSGSSTPTAFGDYLAGPNHVLPTGGAGRSFSGLSTRDFVRWGRSVSFPAKAARRLAGPAATLARFEGLDAHARALARRAR
ncbi:MAG: histidinol dehydrogenase [Acidobacteria bacterium]|nr:MAG: histidinol dehydrogenase [Acidobacteriota bacterium]